MTIPNNAYPCDTDSSLCPHKWHYQGTICPGSGAAGETITDAATPHGLPEDDDSIDVTDAGLDTLLTESALWDEQFRTSRVVMAAELDPYLDGGFVVDGAGDQVKSLVYMLDTEVTLPSPTERMIRDIVEGDDAEAWNALNNFFDSLDLMPDDTSKTQTLCSYVRSTIQDRSQGGFNSQIARTNLSEHDRAVLTDRALRQRWTVPDEVRAGLERDGVESLSGTLVAEPIADVRRRDAATRAWCAQQQPVSSDSLDDYNGWEMRARGTVTTYRGSPDHSGGGGPEFVDRYVIRAQHVSDAAPYEVVDMCIPTSLTDEPIYDIESLRVYLNRNVDKFDDQFGTDPNTIAYLMYKSNELNDSL